MMLWPALGGHWIELWFLNWLRPRIAEGRGVQVAVRLGLWFGAGVLLAAAMRLTAVALTGLRVRQTVAWWVAGAAFVAVELAAHLGLRLRGRPSFYNGQG